MTDSTDEGDVDGESADERWDVRLAPSAIRDLDEISPRVIPAIIEFLYGPMADNPLRVGKPLRGELTGSYSARRGAYRVLYDVDKDAHEVRVFRVSARSTAYRPR